MAHNLAEFQGKVMMAYQGEQPWHRLGTPMPKGANVEMAMKTASLDWGLMKEEIYLNDGQKIDGKFAVVRPDDRVVLGIVSKDYRIVSNAEAFRVFDKACDQFGLEIASAGALGNGERVWMQAKLPTSIQPIPGDRIDGYFLVSTGHDGTYAHQSRPTPIRVVCQNTLNMAFSTGEDVMRISHYSNVETQLKELEELIANLVHTLELTKETFADLAKKKFDFAQTKSYVESVLEMLTTDFEDEICRYLDFEPKEFQTLERKKRDKIIELVYTGKGSEVAGSKEDGTTTAWAAYNGVTEYVDHYSPNDSEVSSTRSAKSALFGKGVDLKLRALELAVAV